MSEASGAKNGAFLSDPGLALVVARWVGLAPGVRRRIVALTAPTSILAADRAVK